MKIKLIILLIVLSTHQLFSQKQKVYSIVKQPQTVEWYQHQFNLWNAELKTNPKNAEAWQNAYIAMRMIKIKSSLKTQDDLNAFIKKMQKAIPNTYEYHCLTYYNGEAVGDKYTELFHHVEKAYKMDSTRVEIYGDLLTQAIVLNNKSKEKKYSEMWFNSNEYSSQLLNFGYNLLATCEDKSVIITAGDNDTYPLFLVQHGMRFKENVTVLNIYLLQHDGYRNSIFKTLGISKFSKKEEDFENSQEFMKAIAQHLEKHLTIPLYYSTTVPGLLYKKSEADTYVVGLALKYCKDNLDNIALLKKNFEQHYKLDYLTTSFSNDISQQVVYQSNQAYLLGLITLYNHYKLSGNEMGKNKIEKLIKTIAQQSGNPEQVMQYLK